MGGIPFLQTGKFIICQHQSSCFVAKRAFQRKKTRNQIIVIKNKLTLNCVVFVIVFLQTKE